jgi:hypothetical protein
MISDDSRAQSGVVAQLHRLTEFFPRNYSSLARTEGQSALALHTCPLKSTMPRHTSLSLPNHQSVMCRHWAELSVEYFALTLPTTQHVAKQVVTSAKS